MNPKATFGKRGALLPYANSGVAAERSTVLPAASAQPEDPWKRRSLPVVSWTLIALLVLIFFAEIVHTSDFVSPFSPSRRDLIALGGIDANLLFSANEWWRLFTAPLLHASPSHIIGNSIALLFAGLILEPLIGGRWFAALFALSALGGSVGSVLQNDPNMVSVGASGGIMGLLAAAFFCSFLFDNSKQRRRMQVISLRILVPALLPALLPTAAIGDHVDYGAHVGGFTVGGAMGFVFNALLSDRESMPFHGIAAGITATVCAVAAGAFLLVAQHRDFYLAQGKDLIPDGLLPKNIRSGADRSSDLVQRFPNDPRSHFYRAWDFIYQRDLSDADSELHVALENPATSSGNLPAQFAPLVKSTLALVLQGEGQQESARTMARDVCANKSVAPLGSELRRSLENGHLCD